MASTTAPRNRRTSAAMDSSSHAATDDAAAKPPTASATIVGSTRRTRSGVAVAASIVAAGLLFGFGNEKSLGYNPEAIHGQMTFRVEALLKLFLAGMAGSLLAFSAASKAIPKAFREFHYKTTQIANRGRNLKAHIVGGLLIGAGMSISGSCPGMAYVQVGAGYASALMAVLGGITGAWAYATFVHDQLAHVLRTHKGSPPTLHGYFKTSFAPTALAVAVVVMAIIAVAEALFPWNGPTEARLMPAAVYAQRDSWTLVDGPWPAYYGGVTLGLAQLLVLWSMATGLGSTSGFQVVACFLSPSEFAASQRKEKHGAWQISYALFVALGAYLSAVLTRSFGTMPDVSHVLQFVGAFLYIFGSRVAGGCTSGHGLTGVGALNLHSIASTMMMFGGGIPTAMFMRLVLGMQMPILGGSDA